MDVPPSPPTSSFGRGIGCLPIGPTPKQAEQHPYVPKVVDVLRQSVYPDTGKRTPERDIGGPSPRAPKQDQRCDQRAQCWQTQRRGDVQRREMRAKWDTLSVEPWKRAGTDAKQRMVLESLQRAHECLAPRA